MMLEYSTAPAARRCVTNDFNLRRQSVSATRLTSILHNGRQLRPAAGVHDATGTPSSSRYASWLAIATEHLQSCRRRAVRREPRSRSRLQFPACPVLPRGLCDAPLLTAPLHTRPEQKDLDIAVGTLEPPRSRSLEAPEQSSHEIRALRRTKLAVRQRTCCRAP